MLAMAKKRPRRTGTLTAKQITAARIAAGMTQQEAADAINVSRTTWSYWEAGMTTPTPSHCQLIRLVIKKN